MTRKLTILSVAYALAPVGPDAVGGAEQVLSALDCALTDAGHHSIVVACNGSVAFGALVSTGVDPKPNLDCGRRQAAQRATLRTVERVLQQTHVDVLHLHGLDFAETLPKHHPPTLVTLHLPPSWYTTLSPKPGVWMHCVSSSQFSSCAPGLNFLPPVENGVDIDRLSAVRHAKRRFALMLGRVCPEKGHHLALQAAHNAAVPLLIGGAVFPYPEHQAYFEREVIPFLDSWRQFLGPLTFARKRRLLSAASCLLVPSVVAETSSLVAMEAMACGTPVIAFKAGALTEIVSHGRTGFLVDTPQAMADAIRCINQIDSHACRREARERFSLDRMTRSYFSLYEQLAGRPACAA